MDIRTLVWLFCFVAAFTATHLPPSNLPSTPWLSDKVEHSVGFAILGFVTFWRFGSNRPAGASPEFQNPNARQFARRDMNRILKLGAFLACYASVDELTQPLVSRSCEAFDWVADMAGATIGLATGFICFRDGAVSR